jgi:uncharacterized integral membrane protein
MEGGTMQTNPLTPRTSVPPPPARKPAIGAHTRFNGANGDPRRPTRAALVWTATVAVLVLLGLLIVFILQNQEQVSVQYFGLVGSVPLGIALSIAAVLGGLFVAVTGAIRIVQLRTAATRLRRRSPTRPPTKTRHQLFRHGHPAR